jgi:hypothetical protein
MINEWFVFLASLFLGLPSIDGNIPISSSDGSRDFVSKLLILFLNQKLMTNVEVMM